MRPKSETFCFHYWRISREFKDMLHQGGGKIYATPAVLKEMVDGEEAWIQLKWKHGFVSKKDTYVEREIVG